jgi:hypothetical protein
MSWGSIFEFLKGILPTKKIAAWIVGILAAVVALFMGVNATDLKATYCATPGTVELPKLPSQPAAAAPAVAPATTSPAK